MASDKVYIYDSDDIRLNVIDESNIDVTIINESPSVEVITVYEQGPQGPRGEKGDTPDLPTEIISGSGADSLIPIFVNGGYITGSQRLFLSGSTFGVSGSLYIGTAFGNSVNIAGYDSGNKLSTIYIGSGLNLNDNTLNAVGSLTGTGSIYQVSYWTSSTAISGSPGFTFNPVSSDLTVAGTLYANTFSGSNAYLSGDVFVGGKVTAREFHTDYVSSSIIYESGSTQFGNSLDDTHIFTGSIYVSGSINTVSHIDFSTSSISPFVPGRVSWNPDFGTLDLGMNGGNVKLSWGLELAAYVVNGESTTLLNGEVVYMSGSRGDKPKVYRASNSMESTSTKTFGVVTEPILPNQLGYVTTQGVVDGLDLGSYNSGDAVWLGSTPGTFTSQKPQAPSHSVFVGIVERANAGNGQLFVAIQNGYELDELHNVRIVNPTNGNLIAYDSSVGLWKNTNIISSSLTVSGSLNVDSLLISGSSNSQLLRVASPLSQNIVTVNGNTSVGLGTTGSSAYRLDVSGSIRSYGNYVGNSAPNAYALGSSPDGVYTVSLGQSNGYWGLIRNVYYPIIGFTDTANIALFNAERVLYQSRLNSNQIAVAFYDNATQNYNWFRNNTRIGGSNGVPTTTLQISGSSGSGLFEIDSDSSQNIIYVSGSGNVGIGTNTPNSLLFIQNNNVSGLPNFNSGIILNNSSDASTSGNKAGPALTFLGKTWSANPGVSNDAYFIIRQDLSEAYTNTGRNALTINSKIGNAAEVNLLKLNSTGQQLEAPNIMTDGAILTSTAGINLKLYAGSNALIGVNVLYTSNDTNTTGDRVSLGVNNGYAPTSGNSTRTWISVNPTVNQTGGASGITRGLRINPTLTSAADWRSIEWSNNTGWGLYGSGNATNFISGALLIGSTNRTGKSLEVSGSGNFTGDLTVTGSFQLSSSLFQYSDNTDVDTGTEVVATIPTGSYRSAFFDYVISSGSNARAGTVFSVWGGSSVEYTETSTNDIGNTTPVSLFAALNGANIELRATTTADNWSVKSLVRML